MSAMADKPGCSPRRSIILGAQQRPDLHVLREPAKLRAERVAGVQGQQLQLSPGQAGHLQRLAGSWDVPQHVVASLHSHLQGSLHASSAVQLQGLSLCSPSGACYRCACQPPGCRCSLVMQCCNSHSCAVNNQMLQAWQCLSVL